MGGAAERIYEHVLVLRCQTGDADAFAELVERYDRRLRYYMRRLMGAGPSSEDALQAVWLQVWRRIGDLRSPGALRVWLYRIARNAALAAWRGRRESDTLSESADVPIGEAPDLVMSAERAAEVHAALERLRPPQCEVLVLRFVEDMTYDEIAALLEVPVGTVRSRLHHAKAALREALGG